MLHIITPLYLPQYLEKVWYSINADEDITWHISKTKTLEIPDYDFLKTDKRIKLYEIDCQEHETWKKRNGILETISDGYFCFLDDDTTFHENMYVKYKTAEESNFKGMIIGNQLYPNGSLRLKAHKPQHSLIDTGNVLSYHSPLSKVRWPENYIHGVNQRDTIFWTEVYEFFNKQCNLINETISVYNKLSNKLSNSDKALMLMNNKGRKKF